jgi:Fe-S-cluster containining protein
MLSIRVSELRDVASKVDDFFARVRGRYGSDMQCDSGCSDCCVVRLTVTNVEACEIRNFVAGLSPAARAGLAANVAASTTACAALDPAGRCLIYDARPIVCRSHGVPVRMRSPGALPVIEA